MATRLNSLLTNWMTRRKFLLGLLISPAARGAAQPPVKDEWAQFRGHPQLNGVAVSALPENLKLLWTHEAGDSIESSAAIVDGAIYVGSQSGDLIALDLATGATRWKYRAQEGIGESSPAVRDGVVYVGDLSGTFHAVAARDGKSIWKFKTGAEIKSSPVVAGDKILFGSYDGNLYCLGAGTGAVHWKFLTGGYVHCTPGVDAGMAFIAGCDENFRGIRIADGKEVFHISSGGYNAASPAISAQTAFFGTFNNEVLGLNLATRRVSWRYAHPDRHFPFIRRRPYPPARWSWADVTRWCTAWPRVPAKPSGPSPPKLASIPLLPLRAGASISGRTMGAFTCWI
jgi:outer membrane protein assembly factor BamB